MHVAVPYFFLFVPLLAVIVSLPISLNGIGVREGAGIVLFGLVGVDRAHAFSLQFTTYLVAVAVSLLGRARAACARIPARRAGVTRSTEDVLMDSSQRVTWAVALVVFLIAASVYFITLTPTVPFWDCRRVHRLLLHPRHPAPARDAVLRAARPHRHPGAVGLDRAARERAVRAARRAAR